MSPLLPPPIHTIVEGWTGLLDFFLELNGAAFNMTNYTIRLLLSKDGVDFTPGGTFTKRDQTEETGEPGWGDYAPAVGEFVHSHKDWELEIYEGRFEVTDSAGRREYFPTLKRFRIAVSRL